MKLHATQFEADRNSLVNRARAGVTVLELMVAMTMVSFIILVLYQMFDKVQAQMRNAIKQVDSLESGRSVMDILYRDFSRMVVPPDAAQVSFEIDADASVFGLEMLHVSSSNAFFTNKMEAVFFTAYDAEATPTNWVGMGFRVAHPDYPDVEPTNGFGTLYRYETNANRFTSNFRNQFYQAAVSNHVHKIAENIVHFRVNFYADRIYTNITSTFQVDRQLRDQTLPKLLEIELGYLDSETATIAASLGSTNAARQFIATRPEKVSFFRFQVRLRSPQ
jgi:hypothetical protein